MRGEYDSSTGFNAIVEFLSTHISLDAKRRAAAQGSVVKTIFCKIFQSGLARQQHFYGHMRIVMEDVELDSVPLSQLGATLLARHSLREATLTDVLVR